MLGAFIDMADLGEWWQFGWDGCMRYIRVSENLIQVIEVEC